MSNSPKSNSNEATENDENISLAMEVGVEEVNLIERELKTNNVSQYELDIKTLSENVTNDDMNCEQQVIPIELSDSLSKSSSQKLPNISKLPVDLDEDPSENKTLPEESRPTDQNTNNPILIEDKVSTFMDTQQTWRDRNQSSSSGCSVDTDAPQIIELLNASMDQPIHPPKHVRTKGELTIDDLPPVEYLSVSAEDRVELQLLGDVSSVIDKIVVIEAIPNSPPLDMDSVLFFKDRRVFGQVFETFGRVKSPYYIVRFNCKEDIVTHGIVAGISVYYAANETAYSTFVLPRDIQLASKGSDASWKDNNEPPITLLEFSDDEEERVFKRRLKNKEIPTGETDNTIVLIEDNENPSNISQDNKRARPNKIRKRKSNISSQLDNSSVNSSHMKSNDKNAIRSNHQTGNWFSNSQPPVCQFTRPTLVRPPPHAYNSCGNSRPSFVHGSSYSTGGAFPDLSRPPPPHIFNRGVVAPAVNANPPHAFQFPNQESVAYQSPAYSTHHNYGSPYLPPRDLTPMMHPFPPAPVATNVTQCFINNPPPPRPNWPGYFPST